jgi:hypothetical protein
MFFPIGLFIIGGQLCIAFVSIYIFGMLLLKSCRALGNWGRRPRYFLNRLT